MRRRTRRYINWPTGCYTYIRQTIKERGIANRELFGEVVSQHLSRIEALH